MTTPFKRVHLIVMDSVGIGECPDAAAFNDEGSHTLKHTLEGFDQSLPNLEKLANCNRMINFIVRAMCNRNT
ncbi:hypothetical protein QRX48_07310, partial [Staphylococcus warneri]